MAISKFYHLPGRKLPLPSQTKPVLVKYTVGPIQIRGMGTRQLSVKLRFVLLSEGLLAWLFYQFFIFPEQLLSPLLVP
jgi:hypothetical protein